LNLNVGINLDKEMGKLVRRKRMPYHNHNHEHEGEGVYSTMNKYQSKEENKGMFKGKTEYYVLAAGVIGAVAGLGLATTMGIGNKKKNFLW